MNSTVTTLRHILEEIVLHKKQEVAQMRQKLPLTALQKQLTAAPKVREFLTALQQSPYQPSLIAEVLSRQFRQSTRHPPAGNHPPTLQRVYH